MDYNKVFEKHLFRASSLGYLLAEGKEKSNFEKWQDAVSVLNKIDLELSTMPQFLKDGKTISKSWVKKKEARIMAFNLEIELSNVKDKITLSDGAKTHLMDVYIFLTTGRKGDIENRYVRKGNMVEDESITLYSRVKKMFFKKNEQHLKNPWIKGTPDIFEGESIHTAIRLPDIKSSWSLRTFYQTFKRKLNPIYFWQIIAYMWLTGARSGSIAYCLVDTPESLIQSEIDRIWYKMGKPLTESPLFLKACEEIRAEMTYSDIPVKQRLLEYEVEWKDEYIDKIKKYVEAGREYLIEIHRELTLKQSA